MMRLLAWLRWRQTFLKIFFHILCGTQSSSVFENGNISFGRTPNKFASCVHEKDFYTFDRPNQDIFYS